MRAIFFVILTFCLAACGAKNNGGSSNNDSAPGKNAQEQELEQQMNILRQQIKETIGTAQCTLDQNCRALAMGAKPCGGPWAYEAYSLVNTDTAKLQQLAQQHHDFEVKLNELRGTVSNCAIIAEPPVACLNSRCMVQ